MSERKPIFCIGTYLGENSKEKIEASKSINKIKEDYHVIFYHSDKTEFQLFNADNIPESTIEEIKSMFV